MPKRRPPRTSDLIRWFVDAGLKPRVQIDADGSVIIESMPDSLAPPATLKENEMAKRINRIGKLEDGKGVGKN